MPTINDVVDNLGEPVEFSEQGLYDNSRTHNDWYDDDSDATMGVLPVQEETSGAVGDPEVVGQCNDTRLSGSASSGIDAV